MLLIHVSYDLFSANPRTAHWLLWTFGAMLPAAIMAQSALQFRNSKKDKIQLSYGKNILHFPTRCALAALLACAAPSCWALSSVTVPTVVAAGDDYASEVLANAWDMNDAADMDTEDSGGVANQTFSGGVYSALTTAGGSNGVYPLFMGYASSANVSRGFQHPIDTSHYRYFTVKMRVARSNELALLVFLQGDSGSYNAGTCGETGYLGGTFLPASTWIIYTFDLVTNNVPGPVCKHLWTDFPQVSGLEFIPALDSNPAGGAQFDIDWMRLTPVATSAQKALVTWSDTNSGSYTITANEVGANGASVALGTSATGTTSFLADLTILPAGQYTITVARTGASATSNTFRINATPQPHVTTPDFHGDQSQDFATTVVGNPWGPMDSGDFIPGGLLNYSSVNYSTFPNSFYGRPANSDPENYLNLGGHPIDTSFFRSFCVSLEVFGPRGVGLGSVARVFWGNAGQLTTSQDIVLDDNAGDTLVGEYCFPDLAALPLESSPPPNGGQWSGTKTLFRVDPDEFTPPGGCSTADTCHDVRIDSVRLSPFYQANPGFTFKWNVSDADDANMTLSLYLDRDTTFGNGNEILIHSASVAGGSGQFVWAGSSAMDYGAYNVYLLADDGKNSVGQYSTGPVLVGARDGIFRNGFEAIP